MKVSKIGDGLAYIGGILFFIIGFLLVIALYPSSESLTLFPFGVGVEFQIIGIVIIVWQEITNLRKDVNNKESETLQEPSQNTPTL